MKNINNLKPLTAVIFRNEENEILTLIKDETNVKVIVEKAEYGEDNIFIGTITFVNEDAIEINNGGLIHWEYVEEIIIQ